MDKVGILTFEQFQGRKNLGSSRIRGQWLINHWENAELFRQGQKYDAVIYQKAYFVDHARNFKGIKILDLCDPDFLHWGFRTIEMIEECDAVTTSTEALAVALRQFTNKPVVCIPDRIDLDEVNLRKTHSGVARWVAWYGYSSNFDMLRPVVAFLKRLNINLIVISDNPFSLPAGSNIELRNYPHNWNTVYRDLLEADFIVNPQSSKSRWRFKSNNKTILAWALGLPVAANVEDLKRFADPEERQKEAALRLQEVKDKWDIKYSVAEYKKLIDDLKKAKIV